MAGITVSNPRGEFAIEAAETLLRSLGAATITLRYTERVAGGDARQLGLVGPVTEDVTVGPALLRELDPLEGKRVCELLLSANTVSMEIERRGEASAEGLFAGMSGVVRDEVLWRLESVSTKNVGGVDCVYRLKITE